MINVLTAEAMREADRETIQDLGIPGFTLMETAGRVAAHRLLDQIAPGHDRVLCFAGRGNNGGDALVVARVLHAAGIDTDVFLVGSDDQETEDSRTNRRILEHIANETSTPGLSISRFQDASEILSIDATWIVDGLLGTGIRGDLREPFAAAANAIRVHPARVLSLDVPTGLDADTGKAAANTVYADMTVCMGALKPGVLLNDGRKMAGELAVAEIGIPDFIMRRHSDRAGCGFQPDRHDIAARLPSRSLNANKYSSGTLVVLAGSPGLTGAPALSSQAAMRVGAGAGICATRASSRRMVEEKVVEVMVAEIPDDDEGILDGAEDMLVDHLSRADSIVIGCGLGRERATGSFVRRILADWKGPAVVDADALFALSGDIDFIKRHANGRWILTPHKGEFDRLVGSESDWNRRAEIAARFAREWNCVLFLKGNPSIIGFPDRPPCFNPTGNESLATAGTGDVLAGMIGGFLAQGLAPADAAICAAWIGGKVADLYADEYGTASMIASDILHRVPDIVATLAAE